MAGAIAEAERNVFLVDDDNDVRGEQETALSLARLCGAGVRDGGGVPRAQDALPAAASFSDLTIRGWRDRRPDRLAERDSAHKVVMLTGSGSIPTAVRAMHAGAVDFIEKPFGFDELVRARSAGH